MSRMSNDEIKDGAVFNGYDYQLQVWVVDGRVTKCGHPASMLNCCNASRYLGRKVAEIPGHDTGER